MEQLGKVTELIVGAHMAATLDQTAQLIREKVTSDMVEPWTWSFAQVGWTSSAADLANTKSIINIATRTVADFLTKYDAILTPTVATPPQKLGYFDTVKLSYEEMYERLSSFNPFTFLYNQTGMPAMSVPLYWNDQGLPIGVQFAGRYGDEATLYRLAGQLEKAKPWFEKIPRIAL